ncbi:response regulator transcription factor [Psychromicrobium sp. YIM B11713]|uniref:helix-turn-helix transcriptional regulator n=1 Tax=Psychromicrobium sp. YIM B11713 TaxID=3145233 RepID=UPI00374EA0DE
MVKVKSVLAWLGSTAGVELGFAPHIAGRLFGLLGGDEVAVAEVGAKLSAAQRAGQVMLPDPLPVVPAVLDAVGDVVDGLTETERAVLLRAGVAVFRKTPVLLNACGLGMAEVASGQVAVLLRFVAGGFSFVDQRVRAVVHEQASLSERSTAHGDLYRAFQAAGEAEIANWHRTLSAVEGEQDVTAGLLELARSALKRGKADWAHAVSREAACRASAELADEARLLAAETALQSGCLLDAMHWASSLTSVPSTPAFRDPVSGTPTPGIPITVSGSQTADSMVQPSTLASSVLTAQPSADEPISSEAEELLSYLDDFVTGRLPKALIENLEHSENSTSSLTIEYERAAHAFRLAEKDAFEPAIKLLAEESDLASSVLSLDWSDWSGWPDIPTPIGAAVRGVARALVYYWAGNLRASEVELSRAALSYPVGSIFGRIACQLARRLDIDIRGTVGPLAETLTQDSPFTPVGRIGSLLDRAVLTYLQGRSSESQSLLAFAAERIDPRAPRVYLPQLDSPLDFADSVVVGRSERQREFCRLRSKISVSTLEDLLALAADCVKLSRGQVSAFERGRTELELGRAFDQHDQHELAKGHFLIASYAFEEAGARAWRAAADRELVTSQQQPQGLTRPEPLSGALPAEASHNAETEVLPEWTKNLTERETEVARLVATGLPNREVAHQLHLSVRTVEVHLSRIFAKLGLRSRVELTIQAHHKNPNP